MPVFSDSQLERRCNLSANSDEAMLEFVPSSEAAKENVDNLSQPFSLVQSIYFILFLFD